MQDSSVIAHGVPSWVDLASPDTQASSRFYQDVFGWTAGEADPEFGGYFMFSKDGKEVAGIGPQQMEGQPPAWTTYVSVDDADVIAEKVKAGGGQVYFGPMDVGNSGRMAVFADPTGAAFGVWQAKDFPGAAMFNVAGAVAWNEVGTPEIDRASSFYQDLFGWTAEVQGEGSDAYTTFSAGGRPIAGGHSMAAAPAGTPPHWLTYFGVADLAAAEEKIKAGGGQIRMGPTDTPFGKMDIVSDPHGAVFAAIEIKNQT